MIFLMFKSLKAYVDCAALYVNVVDLTAKMFAPRERIVSLIARLTDVRGNVGDMVTLVSAACVAAVEPR